jgi:drug/metabolite transporter (DMT)-like permease
MDENIIRSILLFVIGVVLILFPERIFRYQAYVIGKLNSKYDAEKDTNHNVLFGVILVLVSMVLLGVALT